jgi:hypothetical protein
MRLVGGSPCLIGGGLGIALYAGAWLPWSEPASVPEPVVIGNLLPAVGSRAAPPAAPASDPIAVASLPDAIAAAPRPAAVSVAPEPVAAARPYQVASAGAELVVSAPVDAQDPAPAASIVLAALPDPAAAGLGEPDRTVLPDPMVAALVYPDVLAYPEAAERPDINIKLGGLDIADECLTDVCIDYYLWALYERAPKVDSNKVIEKRKHTVKQTVKRTIKKKTVTKTISKTITRSYTKYVDADFTWKDPIAAEKTGMTLKDYVIGGIDRNFKRRLYHALRAMDEAGLEPGITSGFRDDYRQAIATGNKAATGMSFHGGSQRGGYGHGMAIDLVSVKGKSRWARWLSSVELWKWIDAREKELGIGRPYLDRDPPHIVPIEGREFAAKRGVASQAATLEKGACWPCRVTGLMRAAKEPPPAPPVHTAAAADSAPRAEVTSVPAAPGAAGSGKLIVLQARPEAKPLTVTTAPPVAGKSAQPAAKPASAAKPARAPKPATASTAAATTETDSKPAGAADAAKAKPAQAAVRGKPAKAAAAPPAAVAAKPATTAIAQPAAKPAAAAKVARPAAATPAPAGAAKPAPAAKPVPPARIANETGAKPAEAGKPVKPKTAQPAPEGGKPAKATAVQPADGAKPAKPKAAQPSQASAKPAESAKPTPNVRVAAKSK